MIAEDKLIQFVLPGIYITLIISKNCNAAVSLTSYIRKHSGIHLLKFHSTINVDDSSLQNFQLFFVVVVRELIETIKLAE